MSANEWVLWGTKPAYGGTGLRITCGSLAHCRAARAYRSAEGWTGLVILRPEIEYVGVTS